MQRLLSAATRPTVGSVRCIPQLVLATRTTHKTPPESFLNGSSSIYIDEMYEQWSKDPQLVHKSWDLYFHNQIYQRPSTLGVIPPPPALLQSYENTGFLQQQSTFPLQSQTASGVKQIPFDTKVVQDHMAVQALIRSFQVRGHKAAQLDPLEISTIDLDSERPNDLSFEFF